MASPTALTKPSVLIISLLLRGFSLVPVSASVSVCVSVFVFWGFFFVCLLFLHPFPLRLFFLVSVDVPLDDSEAIEFSLESETQAVFHVGFVAPQTPEAKAHRHVANFFAGKRSYKLSLQVLAVVPPQKPRKKAAVWRKEASIVPRRTGRAPLKALNSKAAAETARAVKRPKTTGAGEDNATTATTAQPRAMKMPSRKRLTKVCVCVRVCVCMCTSVHVLACLCMSVCSISLPILPLPFLLSHTLILVFFPLLCFARLCDKQATSALARSESSGDDAAKKAKHGTATDHSRPSHFEKQERAYTL